MRLLLLFFSLLSMSCQEQQPYVPISPQHEFIRYTGRFYHSTADTVRFGWSGSTIELAFSGTSCQVEMRNVSTISDGYGKPQSNFFEVWVDDFPAFTMEASNDSLLYTLAAGLPDTVHTIKLFKRTEGASGYCELLGFRLDLEREAMPLPFTRAKKMEFIGNSITCGYGNEGDSARCKFTPATENGYMAYGAITARLLGAQYTAVASSGIGVYQNYNQEREGSMTEVYRRIYLQNDSVFWKADEAPADVVVINLGTNDIARGLRDKGAFLSAYADLMLQAHEYHPDAAFFCLLSPMVTDAYPKRERRRTVLREWLKEIVSEFSSRTGNRAYFYELTEQGPLGYGCDFHPNVAQHKRNADELSLFIADKLGWKLQKAGK